MIICLFAICAVILTVGIIMIVKADYDGLLAGGIFLTTVSGVCVVACIITALCMTNKVVSASTIDDRLAILEEQNADIEAKVGEVVEKYMQHEDNTYGPISERSNESSIVLVTLYPELNSNTLMTKLVTLYEKNNREILELRLEKVTLKTTRWWLYFGG